MLKHRRSNHGLPLAERHANLTDRRGPDECWPWTGGASQGYGRLSLPDGKITTAHRVSVFLDGRDPTGLLVDHMCMNKLCQNPRHLRCVDARTSALENNPKCVQAQNAAKEACIRGHPLTGANLRIVQPGYVVKNRHGTPRIAKHPTRECNACYLNRLLNPRASKRYHPSLDPFLVEEKRT